MKILHTSDLHIGSPLTSRIAPLAAQKRRRELLLTFERLIDAAKREGAGAFIIAGDLFDTKKVTKSAKARVLGAISDSPQIKFIYISGNHEGDALSSEKLPQNLISLSGDGWSYYTADGVCFASRQDVGRGMFEDYTPQGDFNVAILHGELREYTDGAISPKEASGRGIDYLALGHYHSYSENRIDEKTVAVYSGTPHARGFDEAGEVGYVIIDTESAPVQYSFKPLEGRRIYIRKAPISDSQSQKDVENKIRAVCADVKDTDILRVELVGEHSPDFTPNTHELFDRLQASYFHLEISDKSKIRVDAESLMYDKTLKGEFIRLVMGDEALSDEEKSKIINFGIRSLMGETPDE